jgi:hypothetical protein
VVWLLLVLLPDSSLPHVKQLGSTAMARTPSKEPMIDLPELKIQHMMQVIDIIRMAQRAKRGEPTANAQTKKCSRNVPNSGDKP